MKEGESFQLSESWWKTGKPSDLTDTGVSGALRTFITADSAFQAKKNTKNYTVCLKALEAVDKARLVAVGKCGTNPKLKLAKDALGKAAVIEQRKKIIGLAFKAVIEKEVVALEQGLLKETESANGKAVLVTGLRQKLTMLSEELKAQNLIVSKGPPTSNEVLEARKKAANIMGAIKKIKKTAEEEQNNLSGLKGFIDESAQQVAVEYSSVAEQFTPLIGRLKVCIQNSRANKLKYKEITTLNGDYSDLFSRVGD